jgi:hypothetical protein
MKKIFVANILFLLFLAGCKKEQNNNTAAAHLATIKSEILGYWYYQQHDVAYYNAFSQEMYDQVATPGSLYTNPYFLFNTDTTAYYTYPTPPASVDLSNYIVKSQSGVDSLIFSGGQNSLRYQIMSISSSQLVLSRVFADSQEFIGPSGDVFSTTAGWRATFSRTRAPAP